MSLARAASPRSQVFFQSFTPSPHQHTYEIRPGRYAFVQVKSKVVHLLLSREAVGHALLVQHINQIKVRKTEEKFDINDKSDLYTAGENIFIPHPKKINGREVSELAGWCFKTGGLYETLGLKAPNPSDENYSEQLRAYQVLVANTDFPLDQFYSVDVWMKYVLTMDNQRLVFDDMGRFKNLDTSALLELRDKLTPLDDNMPAEEQSKARKFWNAIINSLTIKLLNSNRRNSIPTSPRRIKLFNKSSKIERAQSLNPSLSLSSSSSSSSSSSNLYSSATALASLPPPQLLLESERFERDFSAPLETEFTELSKGFSQLHIQTALSEARTSSENYAYQDQNYLSHLKPLSMIKERALSEDPRYLNASLIIEGVSQKAPEQSPLISLSLTRRMHTASTASPTFSSGVPLSASSSASSVPFTPRATSGEELTQLRDLSLVERKSAPML